MKNCPHGLLLMICFVDTRIKKHAIGDISRLNSQLSNDTFSVYLRLINLLLKNINRFVLIKSIIGKHVVDKYKWDSYSFVLVVHVVSS